MSATHGHSTFKLLRNHQTVLKRGRSTLHSHQRYMRVAISPHPCQHWSLSVFSCMAILLDAKWYLIVLF